MQFLFTDMEIDVKFSTSVLLLLVLVTGSACLDTTLVDRLDKDITDIEAPDQNGEAPAYHGILVKGSDRQTTTLSNVNPGTGLIANDTFLDSGSTTPGLTTTLSKDLALATTPTTDGTIVFIDRDHSVVTWLDPQTLSATAQMSVGEAGFGANPHDYLPWGPEKAYVSRYGIVYGEDDKVVEGEDLIVLNPRTQELGVRIDLSGLMSPAPNTTATTYARPSRLVKGDEHLFVVIQNFTPNWLGGDGVVAVIDPITDSIAGSVTFEGIRNCGGAAYRPQSETLLVACMGVFGEGAEGKLAGSAIVVVDVSDPTAPSVSRTIPASELGDAPLGMTLVWLGEGYLLVVTDGIKDWGTGDIERHEIVWLVDLEVENDEERFVNVYEGGPFDITVFADPANARFYIGDAEDEDPRVEVFAFDVETGAFQAEQTLRFEEGLPPREIAGY